MGNMAGNGKRTSTLDETVRVRKEYVGAWRKIIGAKLLTASSDRTISTGKKRYLSFSCRDVCRAIKEARESYAAVRGGENKKGVLGSSAL